MDMPGRTYNAGNYAYGFGGKRKDNEMYGEGNAYDFGGRIFDPRIVRWMSADPLAAQYPHQSPYVTMSNDWINRVDPTGMGDYYDKEGKKLGSDGKTVTQGKGKKAKQVSDDKAYVTSQAAIDKFTKDGKTDWDAVIGNSGCQLLSTTNTDLGKLARIIYGESSGDMTESFAIGTTARNYAQYRGSISVADAAKRLSSIKDGKTQYDNARYSMAAAINALTTNGVDYSGGAILWDGFDLAQLGFDQIKPRTLGVEISPELFSAFKSAWPDKEIQNFSGNKKATFSSNFSSGIHLSTEGTFKGICAVKALKVHGRTIFWGINMDPIISKTAQGYELRLLDNNTIEVGDLIKFTIEEHPNSKMKSIDWKNIFK